MRDEVTAIMRWSRIHTLRDEAVEVGEILDAVTRPLPSLPVDPAERELALIVLALRERERCRRLLRLGWGGEPMVTGQI
jgi:hypothetical protein